MKADEFHKRVTALGAVQEKSSGPYFKYCLGDYTILHWAGEDWTNLRFKLGDFNSHTINQTFRILTKYAKSLKSQLQSDLCEVEGLVQI